MKFKKRIIPLCILAGLISFQLYLLRPKPVIHLDIKLHKIEHKEIDKYLKINYFKNENNKIKADSFLNLPEIEKLVIETAVIDKIDLMYLNEYNPEDRIHIVKYSNKYDIPIIYLYRQDYIESKLGNDLFRNYKNNQDLGFKQLNSNYIAWFVKKYYELDEPFDPYNNEHSIQVGCAYLKDLYEEFFCNWRLAFEAYNAGPTKVKSFNVPPVSKEYAQCILNGYSSDFKFVEAAARGML